MIQTTLALTIVFFLPADDSARQEPRKPSPIAPSLPLLTDEEEDRLDRIIDRFIEQDTGKLTGEEGKKARLAFEKLGPEAIPALIRGLNRAAKIDHSCPALVIARKLSRMLGTSEDLELLEFARENIGAGVTRSRHMGVLQDLRVGCMLRKNALARKNAGAKSPRSMSVAELTAAAGSERGPRLKQVLIELEQRRGDEVIAALGSAAASYEGETQDLARDLLVRNLKRQGAAVIKEKLKDDKAEVRAAAARSVGSKQMSLGGALIDLLEDSEANVREAAHQALVRLSRGVDFGPDDQATAKEQAEAVKKWRAWWSKQGGR